MGSILKPAVILFAICLVVSAALGFTYSTTKDTIEERAVKDAEEARREVLQSAQAFEAIDLNAVSGNSSDSGLIREAYRGIKDGVLEGYVFQAVTKGYGGEMKITVGIDKEGKTTGVKIGENSETPGLGAKASDDSFISQFLGFASSGTLKVVKGERTANEEIEAISGATISSKAVTRAVQAAIDMSGEFAKEEGDKK